MGRKMLVKRGVCASRWAPTTGKNAAQRVAPGKTAFIKDVATSGNEKNGFHVKWRPRESLFFARWNAAIEENHFYPPPPYILLIAFNRTRRGGGCSICISITVLIFVLDRSYAHACFESRISRNCLRYSKHDVGSHKGLIYT